MKYICIITCSIICLSGTINSAQAMGRLPEKEEGIIDDKRKVADKNKENGSDDGKEKKNWGILPVAIPFYAPEMSGGIGFNILYYYNPDPENPEQKQNEVSLYGAVTLKKQISVGISTEHYFFGNDQKLSGKFEFSYFPDQFWGIGPDTRDDMTYYLKGTPAFYWGMEDYTSIILNIPISYLFKIAKYFYLGPALKFTYEKMTERERITSLNLGIIPGDNGTIISGFGININLDSRDSIFYPLRGVYFDIKGFCNLKVFGSEYTFYTLEMDLRYFQQIYKKHVFAVQGIAKLNHGLVPFQAMPQLGGDIMMRGYLEGRYRDKNYIALQAEYRFPIYWRIAGTLFGSIGQVAPTVKDVRIYWKDLKASWGIGLRGIVDKEQHVAVRFDIGFDKDFNYRTWERIPEFYLMIKESF